MLLKQTKEEVEMRLTIAIALMLATFANAAIARQVTRCIRHPDGSVTCTTSDDGCEWVTGGCR